MKEVHEQADFFHVHDVARRIAGVGSFGLERYSILVDGRGETEGHFLLDLKVQPGSCLTPYLPLPQPQWPNEAERVVAVQRRGQAVAPAFVAPVAYAGTSYVLRELMPTSDSLSLQRWNGKIGRLETVLHSTLAGKEQRFWMSGWISAATKVGANPCWSPPSSMPSR